MRTTLTVDDQLLRELKARAHREGVPLKQMVNMTLQRGLAAPGSGKRKPFRARTYAMGRPLVPTLDKSLQVAAALEDEEMARKLTLRK